MKKSFFFFAVLIFLQVSSVLAEEAAPVFSQERAVLRTSMGDIVLAFYPDAAPQHVEKFKTLSQKGLYDGSIFFLVYPNYVVQAYGVRYGGKNLSTSDLGAAKALPVETSALKNTRGRVAFAQDLKNKLSDESSFTIFLGNAPVLDGKNTVFAEVVHGMDVADAMSQVKADPKGEPYTMVTLDRIEIAPDEASLGGMGLRGLVAHVEDESGVFSPTHAWTAALMMFFGLLTFLSVGRFSGKVTASIGLLGLLVGFFILYMYLTPIARRSNWMGLALFLAALGIFKIMSFFEAPPKNKP